MAQLTPPRLVTYLATVTSVRHLGPRFLRVTFGGTGLAEFTCTGTAPKIKAFIPELSRIAEPVGATEEFLARASKRTYTVREHRPELNEVDIDFVIHEDGPAGRWAAAAAAGHEIVLSNAVGTPALHFDRVLLVGDPSALPAVMTVLDTLPPGSSARIVMRIDTPDERMELEGGARGITRWVETGSDLDALAEAVRGEVSAFAPDYVWAAGEAGSLRPLRRFLREEADYTKSSSHTVGYWRRDATADVFEPETLARAEALVVAGVALTRKDLDELSVDERETEAA